MEASEEEGAPGTRCPGDPRGTPAASTPDCRSEDQEDKEDRIKIVTRRRLARHVPTLMEVNQDQRRLKTGRASMVGSPAREEGRSTVSFAARHEEGDWDYRHPGASAPHRPVADRVGAAGVARAALLVVTLGLLVAGGVAWAVGAGRWDDVLWAAATIGAPAPAVGWVVASTRAAEIGGRPDRGARAAGHPRRRRVFAGALIAVMLATGRALDAAAQRRATRDLRALLERAPRTARRRVGDVVSEVPVDEVAVGDLVLVGPGRCCRRRTVEGGPAVLDESALTGEPDLVERARRRCGAQWHAQRRGRVRGALHRARRAKHLRRLVAWSSRPGRRTPRCPAGRPVRRLVPAAVARRRRAGLDVSGSPNVRWRCWSWPPRARCCWPPRSRSCRGCRARRGWAW